MPRYRITNLHEDKVSPERLREVIQFNENRVMVRRIGNQKIKAGARAVNNGYVVVDGFRLNAMRVAWTLEHGAWPEGRVINVGNMANRLDPRGMKVVPEVSPAPKATGLGTAKMKSMMSAEQRKANNAKIDLIRPEILAKTLTLLPDGTIVWSRKKTPIGPYVKVTRTGRILPTSMARVRGVPLSAELVRKLLSRAA